MKKIVVLICFLISSISYINAQCPTGNIILTTQAEVDAFAINTAGCTATSYTISISGSDISDISGLSHFQSIGSNLFIENTSLTDLNGLHNVESIDGHLIIRDNLNLSSINNLSLINIGGILDISGNPQLQNLDGLEGITNLNNGALVIDDNDMLTNIDGLSNIQNIAYNVFITNNDMLSNCTAMCLFLGNGGTIHLISNNLTNCNSETEIEATCTPPCPDVIPVRPNGLVATTISESRIGLEWADNSCNEDHFEIKRSLTEVGGYSNIATVPANTTTFTDMGLTANTTYWYKVRAVNVGDNVNSTASNKASATTLPCPTITVPAIPSDLVAIDASDLKINLSWIDNSCNEDNFEIKRSLTENGGYVTIATVSANTTTFTDTGLAQNTTYWYRVRAINTSGNSTASNKASATTVLCTATSVPIAPTNLVATDIGDLRIRLDWLDNSCNEDNFEIKRSLTENGGYVTIATVSANVTAFTDTGLAQNTTYWYRVRAINTNGNAAFTNKASATTILCTSTSTPIPPSDLVATSMGSSTIDLTWSDNSCNEDDFEIRRSLTQSGGYVPITTVPANTTTFTDTGLASNTTYWYRVRAINTNGNSAFTDKASATTFNGLLRTSTSVLNSNNIKVYPNPTSGDLRLEGINEAGADIVIMDINGRVLMHQKSVGESLNISKFPAGIYLLSIKTETDTIVKRIVKQ